jgi:hypothetical protein
MRPRERVNPLLSLLDVALTFATSYVEWMLFGYDVVLICYHDYNYAISHGDLTLITMFIVTVILYVLYRHHDCKHLQNMSVRNKQASLFEFVDVFKYECVGNLPDDKTYF